MLCELVVLVVVLILLASGLAGHHPLLVLARLQGPYPRSGPLYGICPLAPTQGLILLLLVIVHFDLHRLLVDFWLDLLLEIASVLDALRRALLSGVRALAGEEVLLTSLRPGLVHDLLVCRFDASSHEVVVLGHWRQGVSCRCISLNFILFARLELGIATSDFIAADIEDLFFPFPKLRGVSRLL